MGYRVIGLDTGADKKAWLAANGCPDFVDFKTSKDVTADIKALTNGEGAEAAVCVAAGAAAYEQGESDMDR